jgi:serine protease Do/serine protease DegQ
LSAKRYALGLTVVSLTPQLASHFNTGTGGLLITEVRSGSAAEAAGMRAGDCLVALNSVILSTPGELNQALNRVVMAATPSGLTELTLTVVRDKRPAEILIKL